MSLSPILVTGAHRSGTTFVGRMISRARGCAYIDEPFHIHHHPGICGAVFSRWFTYVCEDNASDFYLDIRKCLTLRYNLAAEIRAGNIISRSKRIVRQYPQYAVYRMRRARPVVKDPIALFSAEWLAATFNMKVVVMIRHPAAFAGSLKVMNWTHPFADFLEQPLLMRDHLYAFQAEIEHLAKTEQPLIDQAILLWKLTLTVILQFRARHPDWIVVRHEDLSREPERVFRDVFERLSLPYTGRIERTIRDHTRPGNPIELMAGQNTLIRDSRANSENWRTRLTESEIKQVHDSVMGMAGCPYSEDEW